MKRKIFWLFLIIAIGICVGIILRNDISKELEIEGLALKSGTDFLLPKPQKTGGLPLFDALMIRKTVRKFSDRRLSLSTISTLIWAANGINRPDGKRTAPSALNKQEIDIYFAHGDSVWLYEPKEHNLKIVATNDAIKNIDFGPYALILVGNSEKQANENLMHVDAGFIGQNIYLCCAMQNIGCVFRGSFDRAGIEKALKLQPERKLLYLVSFGAPLPQ